MIYVRSKSSIQLFPRVVLALFLLFFFYVYLQPSGFHSLALGVLMWTVLTLQIFCIRVFEVEAFQRGHVSLEQPR